MRNSEKGWGVSSYFAVEILYEGIFGHVTTFGMGFQTCKNCANSDCYKHSNNKSAQHLV